jgi:flavin reductase (DIM6/NTAB) family NADH-FMN oxidoreductase RutF
MSNRRMAASATIGGRRAAMPAAPAFAPAAEFAEAMGGLATGVVLVTSWVAGRPWGMTATAVASVSADPPTILVSLGSGTVSARAIAASGAFGVGILAAGRQDLARLASEPGAPKFLEPFAEPYTTEVGSPVVEGALAHLNCSVASRVVVADHTVFFGHVRAVRLSDGGEPLLYFRRAYRQLAAPGAQASG